MDYSNYLTTKLYMPPIKNSHVSREALINKINEGKDRGHKVILVSAEAGYGKTTFVSEWISKLNQSYVWLSLDKYDNDSVTFINYLIFAIRKIDASFGSLMENIMSSPRLPGVNVISSYLIAELSKLKENFILIFDDYQIITNTYIHKLIQRLIDSNVQNLFTVIITRRDPPFTLSMWRAKDILTELGPDDLRLQTEEIQEFFEKKFALCFEDKSLEILEGRTEGWVAALQLIGLSLMNKNIEQQEKSLIERLNGNNRLIADYLMEEVFKRQNVQIRTFLKMTGILKSFNEELCNTVTGIDSSRQIIEQLERENLFIAPLDSNRNWYRYNHLFSEFLSAGLDKKLRTEVLVRASKWCKANGFIELAAEYALEAKDSEMILSLVSQVTLKYLNDGAIKKLLELLNSMRKICGKTDADIGICRAWCLFIIGETAEAYKALKELNSNSEIIDSNILGKIKALEAVIYASTNMSKAYLFAMDAVNILRDGSRVFYNIALRTLGLVKKSAGEITQAAAVFKEIIDGVGHKRYGLIELSAFSNYADCLIAMGRRQEAQHLCEELIDEYTDEYGNLLPMAKMVYLPMGVCLYMANELERAKSYIHEGINLCEEMKLMCTICNAEGVYIKLLYALNEKNTAFKKVYKYKSLSRGPGLLGTLVLLEAIENDLNIREKNNVSVLKWIKTVEGVVNDTQYPYYRSVILAYVRALIAQERFTEAADKLTVEESTARKDGRYEQLITILILSALIKKCCNDENKALEYISEALQIAAPEGYIRSFLDESQDVMPLVRKVRYISPDFVDQLNKHKNMEQDGELIENLKDKEHEIIELIAEGMSNNEISSKLYITTGTVKWYINKIYAKLGVNKRTQAVKKARQLGIIK